MKKLIIIIIALLSLCSCSLTHRIIDRQKELSAIDQAKKAPYKAHIQKNPKKDRQALNVTLILIAGMFTAYRNY